MPRHLFLVLAVAALALPAAAAGRSRDAARFAAFAERAHATGTLELSVRFRANAATCAAAGTCGRSGTVSAPLRLDGRRVLRVRGDVVTLPVRGTASATVTDTTAGRTCHGRAAVHTAGLAFTSDRRGVLLRPGASRSADPFRTACRAPRLPDLRDAALPAVRLGTVSVNVRTLQITAHARRLVTAGGYSATVTTDARLVLTR